MATPHCATVAGQAGSGGSGGLPRVLAEEPAATRPSLTSPEDLRGIRDRRGSDGHRHIASGHGHARRPRSASGWGASAYSSQSPVSIICSRSASVAAPRRGRRASWPRPPRPRRTPRSAEGGRLERVARLLVADKERRGEHVAGARRVHLRLAAERAPRMTPAESAGSARASRASARSSGRGRGAPPPAGRRRAGRAPRERERGRRGGPAPARRSGRRRARRGRSRARSPGRSPRRSRLRALTPSRRRAGHRRPEEQRVRVAPAAEGPQGPRPRRGPSTPGAGTVGVVFVEEADRDRRAPDEGQDPGRLPLGLESGRHW